MRWVIDVVVVSLNSLKLLYHLLQSVAVGFDENRVL